MRVAKYHMTSNMIDSGAMTLHAAGSHAACDPQEPPAQSGECPTWLYPERLDPKWGEVTKLGLIIGRGKSRKVVPPDDVYKLAMMGCPDREIAEWFEVSESTLKYNFSAYLSKARSQLKQKLRQSQLRVANDGNAAMLIWLGKNILGQQETPNNTEDNKPLPWTDDEHGN
jgi:hypothetical protein